MRIIDLTLHIELWIFLIGLLILVAYGMLTGTINTRGMLADKIGGGSGSSPPTPSRGGFSPARVQMLLATLAVAFYYVGQVSTTAQTGTFPTIPKEMLYVLGGSHAFYLGSKITRLISERLRTR
jgi:hypothetical protein